MPSLRRKFYGRGGTLELRTETLITIAGEEFRVSTINACRVRLVE